MSKGFSTCCFDLLPVWTGFKDVAFDMIWMWMGLYSYKSSNKGSL